jgi:hypothetical protein
MLEKSPGRVIAEDAKLVSSVVPKAFILFFGKPSLTDVIARHNFL